MKTLLLAKKLIEIPSFVDGDKNEKEIGEFIYQYLLQISWLKVTKQLVTKDRFNVLAQDSSNPQILITGHMDTVQPQTNWSINPFKPIVKNGKLYGLGASDMKGSLASVLTSIKRAGPSKGIMYFFYVDEEYDFLGTKKFISEYKNKIRPKIIFSIDGDDLSFGYKCRGLIEIEFKIKGKSGHAANPTSGNNAIRAAMNSINVLEQKISSYKSKELGSNTINIAYISGGLDQGQETLGKQGNIIADYCEFIVDIRTADPMLDANKVVNIVSTKIKEEGCKIISTRVRHDFGSWLTRRTDLKTITSLVNKSKFIGAKNYGYVDIQMLWKTFGQIQCVTYGPSQSGAGHTSDEYIPIKSLGEADIFFIKLISMYNK